MLGVMQPQEKLPHVKKQGAAPGKECLDSPQFFENHSTLTIPTSPHTTMVPPNPLKVFFQWTRVQKNQSSSKYPKPRPLD